MGFLALLFNVLIFLTPFGVVFRLSPFENVSFYPHDLIVSLIFLVTVFRFITEKKIKHLKLLVLVGLFLLTGFISLMLNSSHLKQEELLISLSYLLRFTSYVSLLFSIQLLPPKFLKTLPQKLIASGLIFAVFGFIQYLFYPNLRNLYYLGWDEHLFRLFSTMLDPNFAGAYLVLAFILSIGMTLSLKSKDKVTKQILSVTSILFLLGVFLTYSRGAFIMLLVGVAALLALHKKYKLLALSFVGLVIVFFIFANRNFEGLNPYRIASVDARIESAKESIEVIKKNPILGVGFNAYRYAQVRYGLREESIINDNHAGAGTDNSYLFVLATTGIIGFVFYLDFWINIIKALVKRIKESDDYAKIALSSVIALMVNTIFINSIFYPLIMVWVFIVVGFTLSRKQ